MDHPNVETMLQRGHTQFGFYRKQNHFITAVGEALTVFMLPVNCEIGRNLAIDLKKTRKSTKFRPPL